MKNISSIFLITFTITLVFIFYSKNTKSQGVEWFQSTTSPNTSDAYFEDVVYDNFGNVYAIGTFYDQITIGGQTYYATATSTINFATILVKYTSTGVIQWVNVINSTNRVSPGGITVDDNGYLYITGGYRGTMNIGSYSITSINTFSNFYENFIAKINPNGTVNWLIRGGDSQSVVSRESPKNYIVKYSNGKIYFASRYLNSTTSNTYSNTFGTSNLSMNTPGLSSHTNIFISKIDTNGTIDWTTSWLRESGFIDLGSIIVNSTGDVFISSNSNPYTQNTIGSYNFTNTISQTSVLLKLNSNGIAVNHLAYRGNSGNGISALMGIVNDNLYLVFRSNQPSTIGSFTRTGTILAKFDSNLNIYYMETIASFNSIRTYGFKITPDNKLIMAGRILDLVTIGGVTKTGSNANFIIKVDTSLQNLDYFFVSEKVPAPISLVKGISLGSVDELYVCGLTNNGEKFDQITHAGYNYDAYVLKLNNCHPFQNSLSPTNPLICNANVTLSTDATNPIFKYTWLNFGNILNGATASSFTTGNTGDYSVVVDSLGCRDTSNVSTVLWGNTPNVSAIPSNITICPSTAPFTLTGGNPIGGYWSGNGVINDSVFDPNVAGSGSHILTYTYAPVGSCSATATRVINIQPITNTFIVPFGSVCLNDTIFNISNNGFPQGGTFTGNGVVGGTQFDPNIADTGTHTLTYTFTDSYGCQTSTTTNITVNPAPIVSTQSFNPVCQNTFSMNLSGGSPSGGTWSGNFVVSNQFHPFVSGSGVHEIIYSITQNGCTASDTQNITVEPPAVANITAQNNVCINSGNITLNGTPSGGTYIGNGVSGNSFNPSITGIGSHLIHYIISNSCGTDTASIIINITNPPTVNFSALPSVCATASAFTLSGGSPIGGTYSGNGISGNQFNPSVAGVGTHTISYTYTDANSCANTATQTITVAPPPTVNLTLPDTICLNSGILNLNSGTPIGGSYSGNGVSGNTFSPLLTGVGTHIISYSYTDGGGCSNTATHTITVYDPANPTWSAPSAVCISSGNISLSAGNPSGGSFSGTGVSGNTFNPSLAGVGLHTITYTISTPCGNRSTSDTIRVNPLPTVNFSALSPVCVSANAFTLSGGTPVGGTYSGNGVSGNQFNPSVAGVGTHTITYTYSDANSCTNTSSQSITVYALPTISFSLPDSVCQNASAIVLSASPSGGTFSGPGVSSGIFTPASAGIGTHSIVYNYTDANSCSASDTQTITVYTTPVSWSAPAAVCISVNSVPLSAGIPSGGTFSGSGIMGNNFIPLMAGIGVHTITYTVSTACGTNSVSDTIRVHALPSVNLISLSPVCVSANAFALSGGSPSGGTYSGNGVSGNSFNPAVAGVGTHTITYTFTNANGCSNSSTQNITVNASPTVNLAPISPVCVDAGSFALSGGTPVGGTYSGTGVSGSNFNPLVAGIGTHTITYTFTNSNGCSASASQNIVVNALPTVSLNSIAPLCVDAASVSLSGTPTGGNFSGNGVTGNSFNPAVAGVGVHPVIYTFTDGNSCSASDTQNVTVNALPNVSLNSLSSVCINALPVTLSGGSPTGGVFSGNGVSAGQFNPQTAGIGSHTITYSFTDANGCSASDAQSIMVNDTTLLSFNGPITLCNNDSLAALNWVNPSGGSYSGNFINNNLLNLDSVPSGVNNFNYTFVNASGCTSTLNDVFTILPRPNVSHSALDSLCGNSEPYALSGGLPSGGTYAGPGVSNNIFNQRNAGGPGNYFISYTVSDSNGCSNSILLPIYVGATPNLNVTRGAEICEGDSVRISASGASSYQWSTNERTASIMVNPTTTSTYFVTGSNPDGCSNTDSVLVVVNPLPIINLGNDTVICLGNTLNLDAGNGFRFYNWNTGANTQQITVPQSSDSVGSFTYIVVVEDLNGCLGADSIRVSVQNCTGIELRDLSSFFILYPNPSNGNFNIDIQWPVSEDVEIILTTTTGRLVFTQKVGLTNTRQQIAFNEHLANGVYFISIKGKAGVAQKRVMVNK